MQIVEIQGQKLQVEQGQSCAQILSAALSNKQMKKAVACWCGQTLLDLQQEMPLECGQLVPVYQDSEQGLEILRHSTAHVMAQAVKKLFPGAKMAIGPAIENGFYYDFEFERSFTPEDLQAIEQEMQEIVQSDLPLKRKALSKQEAKRLFLLQNETYKLELLEEMQEDQVCIYTQDNFSDLCRGPHVLSTGCIQAFKLTSVAGAYWRGDERRPMLQRIYGTAWPSQKAMKKYLQELEEAQKRDHRKLGSQLDLFSFSEEAGPGMPIFHPKGALIRSILEDFETKEHLKRGYQLVRGPQLLRRELWELSGHYENYRENMYFSEIEGQVYGLKPMNCLAHMLVYKSRLRSYRDLPVRLFELGTVHRHEKSGVMHGLLRVRQFTQDDAHIICRQDQLQQEILNVLHFVQDIMQLFDFAYEVEISTRPEKSIGSEQDWTLAMQALQQALDSAGLQYAVCSGEGAFYGPKIDIKLKDALNRKWQCATVQCDFTLPQRFDLNFIGQDGAKHRPVMLHRVILGAIERFLGILIEHFAGAFPTWLSPVQARILNITDEQTGYVHACANELLQSGIRVETDLRNEKLGYKIREAELEKIPYILVAGNKEQGADQLNARMRNQKNLGPISRTEVIDIIEQDCTEPFKRGGMSYSFVY